MTARRVLLLTALLAAASVTAWAQEGPFTINPTSLPVGGGNFVVGQAIPIQQFSTNPPRDEVFTWSVSSGSLPPGLNFDPSALTITGTPTQAGVFTFTIFSQEGGGNFTASQRYSLYVSSGPLHLNPLTHTTAAAGTAYTTLTFQVVGGVPPYTWVLQSGASADGLTLDPSTGQLSGIPLSGGTVPVGVIVTDASGTQTAANFSLNVLGISTASLPNGAIGSTYLQALTVIGGTGPFTWTVTGSAALPPGLTLIPQGQITGTPTASGTFPFQIQVTDSATNVSASKSFSITIPSGLTITTTSLPGGTIGIAYPAQTLAAAGSTNPLTWSLSGTAPLPPGLSLSAQGLITGTPTQVGAFPFQVQVTDPVAHLSGTQALSITVTAGVTISPATLPNGFVNIPYPATTLTLAGTTITNWAVTTGTLPAGLTLNGSTGVLSGKPTAAGSSTFTISAASESRIGGAIIQQQFTLAVNTLTITGLPSIGVAGTQPSATVSLSGGTYPFTITGTLNLAFAPASGGTQPFDAKFANGSGTSTTFTITPPAVASTVPVMIGTVAGTITITSSNLADSNGNTLAPLAPIVITVNPTPPVIRGVTIGTVTSSGFSISVTGYSTPRNMTSALFHFTSPTNTQLSAADVTVPLSTAFTTWYGSSASNAFGSTFVMTVQFSFTGPPGETVPFTTVTATLTNSVGASTTSAPVSP